MILLIGSELKPLGIGRSGKQRTTDFPKTDMAFGNGTVRRRRIGAK